MTQKEIQRRAKENNDMYFHNECELHRHCFGCPEWDNYNNLCLLTVTTDRVGTDREESYYW